MFIKFIMKRALLPLPIKVWLKFMSFQEFEHHFYLLLGYEESYPSILRGQGLLWVVNVWEFIFKILWRIWTLIDMFMHSLKTFGVWL